MAMHWIVIANEAKARIFAADALFDEVEEINDLVHPEGRWRDADLKSDRSGRFAAGASGGRTAADPQTDPRDVEATRFARTVADLLRKGLLENRFERIVRTTAKGFTAPSAQGTAASRSLPSRRALACSVSLFGFCRRGLPRRYSRLSSGRP